MGVDNINEDIKFLKHATWRIYQAVRWATASNQVWQTLNQHPNRQEIANSPASEAAAVYEKTLLDAQIMMVARVFDKPGQGNVRTQNRMSFLVCDHLLKSPDVLDTIRKHRWECDAETQDRLNERYYQFCNNLQTLEDENPNRIKLIRDFRDENIAHELKFDSLPHRPQYSHIHGLIYEARVLISHLQFIVHGDEIIWEELNVEQSAAWLWNAVAESSRH